MAVNQQKLLSVLQDQVNLINEANRVVGYRRDVFETLVQIVVLEREHLAARTQIQKKVTDQTHALATVLLKDGWQPSP